jgi:hypothetical protein
MPMPDKNMIRCRGGLYAHPMGGFHRFSGREPAPTARFENLCAIIYRAVFNKRQ